MRPGVYDDISNSDYHASDGVSKTGLDLVAKSPALYKARYIDRITDNTQTPSMLLGSVVHSLVLEPGKFYDEYAVEPTGINKRTKAGKAEYAEWLESTGGKTIISADIRAKADDICASVYGNKYAAGLLSGGVAEQSYYHVDSETGELVKCRPDYFAEGVLVDLKTTQDASIDAFSRSAYNFRYHVQAAMYSNIVHDVSGATVDNFVFVCVETKQPYSVAVYVADGGMIALGILEYKASLRKYHKCKQFCEWPGLNDDKIAALSLPKWAK